MISAISGKYEHVDTRIDLISLCNQNNVIFIEGRVDSIVPKERKVYYSPSTKRSTTDGKNRLLEVRFDVLLLNVGSSIYTYPFHGAEEKGRVISTRPISRLLKQLQDFENRILSKNNPPSQIRVVMIGGGAAGVELAFNLFHRLKSLFDIPPIVRLTTLVYNSFLIKIDSFIFWK